MSFITDNKNKMMTGEVTSESAGEKLFPVLLCLLVERFADNLRVVVIERVHGVLRRRRTVISRMTG